MPIQQQIVQAPFNQFQELNLPNIQSNSQIIPQIQGMSIMGANIGNTLSPVPLNASAQLPEFGLNYPINQINQNSINPMLLNQLGIQNQLNLPIQGMYNNIMPLQN